MKVGESKVSQRGSVVVPKTVRDLLQLKDGDSIEWFMVPRGEGIINLTVVKKVG